MHPLLERFIGIALIGAAVIGLIFNVIVLVLLPGVMGDAQARVQETLTILNGTLDTTGNALIVVEQSVDDVNVTMDVARSATIQVSTALSDTVPMLDTMASITGQELPNSVMTAQESLDVAQNSARSVESVLFSLNRSLSFLGDISVYDPDESLADTLASVSESLNPLVFSMQEVETSIIVSGENLEEIQGEVEQLALNFDQIQLTIDDARGVTTQYQEVVAEQQALVSDLQNNAGTWITWATYFLVMLLIWLIVAQLGLLSQGVEMYFRSRRALAAVQEVRPE